MDLFIQLKVTQQMMVAELKNIQLIAMLYMDLGYHPIKKILFMICKDMLSLKCWIF